jgi:hypothetical protein
MSRQLILAGLLSLSVPAALQAKPPWLSIELPANPWDQATRGGFLVVHTYHYSRPATGTLSGTAIGVVNGERRSVPLTFEPTERPGDFVVRNQWGSSGRWVLVITVSQGSAENLAQAMVQISEGGAVTGVRVPTRQERDVAIPRPVTQAEIEAALRGGRS